MGTANTSYYGSQIFPSGSYSTATGTANFANTNNAASFATGITSSASGNASGGIIFMQQPFLAQTTAFQISGSDARGAGQGRFSNGFHASATSFTSFTLIASGTTFTSGTVRVYGMRNS
jgi:hypothetical protein